MTSFNRVGALWAGDNYNLITGVLCNERGFNGFVITDYWEGDYMNGMQMLGAGGDAMLISAGNDGSHIQDTGNSMKHMGLDDHGAGDDRAVLQHDSKLTRSQLRMCWA